MTTSKANSSRIDILGVQVNAQPFGEAIKTLLDWAAQPDSARYVCTCPVFTVMACYENATVRRAVNKADMVTADGMPVVWVQRQWGCPTAERVYGPDLMLALFEQTAGQGIRHYFWGGTPETIAQLTRTLQAKFPTLEVAGAFSPPIQALEQTVMSETVERINAANAHIIWVGLGSPKQDLWMSMYRPMLHAPLLIGTGAAFDFLAGTKRQAPRWMQRSGLEWVFRLAQEPRRLWRRYLLYNPLFVWKVLQQTIQQRIQRRAH